MIIIIIYLDFYITQNRTFNQKTVRMDCTNLNIKIVWTLSVRWGDAGLDRLDPGLPKFLWLGL